MKYCTSFILKKMKKSELIQQLVLIAQQVEGIVYCDLQKMQIKRAAQDYPMPMPAVLFDITNVSFTNTAQKHQLGSLKITISAYFDLVTDSFDGAEMSAETLQLLDKSDELFEAFHGSLIPGYGNMKRLQDLPSEYGFRYICFKSSYSLSVKDLKDTNLDTVKPSIKILTNTY
jgi:hypothetical protein